MGMGDMDRGAEIGGEGLDLPEGIGVVERRQLCLGMGLRDIGKDAGFSVSTPRSVMSAGTRDFGLIFRNSGFF